MPSDSRDGFEVSLDQLERVVDDLESGELGLDLALARYEEGVRLLAHCYGVLGRAEQTIALLTGVDSSGQPATEPFDATATADRDSFPRASESASDDDFTL